MRPLVLTNAFRRPRGTRLTSGVTVSADTNVYACVEELVEVIVNVVGASPLMLPSLNDPESVAALLDQVDGILLPGAASNIHPTRYGEHPIAKPQIFDEAHDTTDIFLIQQARKKGIPFLGICRSTQAMNVAFGGSLHQDIGPLSKVDHRCSNPCDGHDDARQFMHPIKVNPTGVLAKILPEEPLLVNSMHGQAVNRLGDGLVIEAWAEDGIIEAISCPNSENFFLGVQWHPEAMPDHPVSQKIFSSFRAAVERHYSQRLSNR